MILTMVFWTNTEENNMKQVAYVELFAFAVLPHISRCGHEGLKDSLYEELVIGDFKTYQIPKIIDALYQQLNCLGLKCEDIGSHILADETIPPCKDDFDMIGYTPVNATKTILVGNISFDTNANHNHRFVANHSLTFQNAASKIGLGCGCNSSAHES